MAIGLAHERVTWSSGTRSKEEGTDLASVCAGLSTRRLVKLHRSLKNTWSERHTVEAELARRGFSPNQIDGLVREAHSKRPPPLHETIQRLGLAADEWGESESSWYTDGQLQESRAEHFAHQIEAREAQIRRDEQEQVLFAGANEFDTSDIPEEELFQTLPSPLQETETMTAVMEAPANGRKRKKSERVPLQGLNEQALSSELLARVYDEDDGPAKGGRHTSPGAVLCPDCEGSGYADEEADAVCDCCGGNGELPEVSARVSPDTPVNGNGHANGNGKKGRQKNDGQKNGSHLSAPDVFASPSAANNLTKPVANGASLKGANRLREPRQVKLVLLGTCHRHPENRVPTAEAVQFIADSLAIEGMHDRPVVRSMGDGSFQILSGETRILAARKLGWKELDADVVSCDDARALELLAIYNAKRKDLTVCEKARMLKRLCDPVDQGGAGMTEAQAGAVYLNQNGKAYDRSSVANLIRLLALPPFWQDLVNAGEVTQAQARYLVRYAHVPQIMEAVAAAWKKDHAPKSREWEARNWEGTEGFEDNADTAGSRAIRHMTKARNSWERENAQFTATPAQREQLGIVEIERTVGYGRDRRNETVEVATNVKLWDDLQAAAKTKGKKSAAAKAGRDEPAQKREPTPAEKKAKAAEQTRLLVERVAAYRHQWLKGLIAERLVPSAGGAVETVFARLSAWLSTAPLSISYELDEKLCEGLATKRGRLGLSDMVWRAIAAVEPMDGRRLWEAHAGLIRWLFEREDHDPKRPLLAAELLEDVARELEIDLAAEWAALQDRGGEKRDLERIERFCLLHQTEQLRDLAKTLGVFAPEAANKAGIVKLVLNKAETGGLKLPASIEPVKLATAKGGKSAKKARGK